MEPSHAIEIAAAGFNWKCSPPDYTCEKLGPAYSMGLGQRWARAVPRNRALQAQQEYLPFVSPDGKWEALIKNFNIFVCPRGKTGGALLSFDGSEDNYYAALSIAWSPDSKKLAAYRVRRGYRREVHYVESSPADQLQPKHTTIEYAKPGDVLDLQQPVLFLVDEKKEIPVGNGLFGNPYELSRPGPVWRKDSRAFTFEYNERGRQTYRVIEVDAANGTARALVEEESQTFFCYSGKKFRHDIGDGKEIIWMSERDGWNHLYLYDGNTGRLKTQITKGNWVVRSVEYPDDDKRQIWFRASGMYPGKDPYFVNCYRINFDGTGLTSLTPGEENHTVTFSPDHKYFVDTWSRVDTPPGVGVTAYRRYEDDRRNRDIHELLKVGWRAPEVFTALGAGWQNRDLRCDLPSHELRSRAQIPGGRKHLRGSAGLPAASNRSQFFMIALALGALLWNSFLVQLKSHG